MKKIALFLATILLIGIFAGCTPPSSEGTESSAPEEPFAFSFEKEAFQGKELTIWAHWQLPDPFGDISRFEEETGAIVTYEVIPYGASYDGSEYRDKVSGKIAAGEGPDACYLWQYAVPVWPREGWVLPWEEIIDPSAAPFRSKLDHAVTEYYTYNEKTYGIINSEEMDFYWIYYDKKIISEAGLEDPYTLFRAGKWTWAKFNEIGQKLTIDADGDGVKERYAFGGYATDGWILGNGTNYVRFANGQPKLALADPAGFTAMEQERDVFMSIKAYSESGEPDEENFLTGKVVMYYENTQAVTKLKEAKGEDLGVVPMPTGPNFDRKKVTAVEAGAIPMFLASTCDEKELLAHYVTWLFAEKEDKTERKAQIIRDTFCGDEELYRFHEEIKQYGVVPNDGSFGRLPKLLVLKVLWNYDQKPSDTIFGILPQAQKEIEEVFYGTSD
ncbi:MAG: extracellular solute-binding protein [Oscillospiraceae bacterium]|nr:extracellular solute-binding protein [Oscillospiraceae bacterium]